MVQISQIIFKTFSRVYFVSPHPLPVTFDEIKIIMLNNHSLKICTKWRGAISKKVQECNVSFLPHITIWTNARHGWRIEGNYPWSWFPDCLMGSALIRINTTAIISPFIGHTYVEKISNFQWIFKNEIFFEIFPITYIDDFDIVIVTKPKLVTLTSTNDYRRLIRKLLDIEAVLAYDAAWHVL